MHVIVTKHALADIDECDAWWRANRPDAPDLVRSELAGALESLAESAQTLPV